ncbi:MAG: hybrid sensor histidine kinase/response regulator [Desulfosarcinaceae bacterium]
MPAKQNFTLTEGKVLFIDDEKDILKSLRRAMRNEPYACLFADSAEKGIDLMQEHSAQVIVCDMRMPKVSGTKLLSQIQKKYPHTIRMMLSGWSDGDSILQAVNDGQIYRYIVKPWDERELKITIRQALELYAIRMERHNLLEALEIQNANLEQTVARRTEQLLALSKQAEIGKYASQIVHNLNNPLHAIAGALDLAGLIVKQDGAGIPQGLHKALDLARRGTGDLQKIVSGILQHARDEHFFHMEKVDVNQVVRQELDYFNIDPIFRKMVKKEVELDPNLPAILGNGLQIKQIVNNLVANAVDAMENNPQRILKVRTAVDGNFILLEIQDSGEGIAQEDLPRLFSPDFSTKPPGKGTGLGLASVKAMVDAYAGTTLVTSEKGKGACFSVRLPIDSTVSDGIGNKMLPGRPRQGDISPV